MICTSTATTWKKTKQKKTESGISSGSSAFFSMCKSLYEGKTKDEDNLHTIQVPTTITYVVSKLTKIGSLLKLILLFT